MEATEPMPILCSPHFPNSAIQYPLPRIDLNNDVGNHLAPIYTHRYKAIPICTYVCIYTYIYVCNVCVYMYIYMHLHRKHQQHCMLLIRAARRQRARPLRCLAWLQTASFNLGCAHSCSKPCHEVPSSREASQLYGKIAHCKPTVVPPPSSPVRSCCLVAAVPVPRWNHLAPGSSSNLVHASLLFLMPALALHRQASIVLSRNSYCR